ncbi:MerR family transcriptional regulator [Metabacillus malikii]|uniref:Chromosome-anchoring protein RacA n=1 Tax=Metabacillus malikii TaxID=1504265 RepID=A0ABT9ZJK9_9BACI|nr:MerR family transcriptional regulator [Metabacillus malikii]MDQ0232155.1 chromosome-anchoring protein RacA [Metabacillus malikii]
MNTATVVKELGVSRRTLMRWVDQLGIELMKNELGHYQFTEDDVNRLKEVQLQSQNESQQTTQTPTKKEQRTGTAKTTPNYDISKFQAMNERIDELERKVRSKADDVVSFQVLQHRKEMEELLSKISLLEEKVAELEQSKQKRETIKENVLVFDQTPAPKPKRKNFISTIFGF